MRPNAGTTLEEREAEMRQRWREKKARKRSKRLKQSYEDGTRPRLAGQALAHALMSEIKKLKGELAASREANAANKPMHIYVRPRRTTAP